MSLQPYLADELEFAWCHRVYFCFRTHRRKSIEALKQLDQQTLNELLESYGVHVLELSSDTIVIRLLVSLSVRESVSTAASKIKGRLSKWLTDQLCFDSSAEKQKWLGRGYFASTTGKSQSDDVSHYLDRQSEHHGYDRRARPPVFVQEFELSNQDKQLLATDHAVTHLRYHLVLATQWRRGVFSRESATEVAGYWRAMHQEMKALVQKVSFLPDHVHIAIVLHPTVSPAMVVEKLMNAAQILIREQFRSDTIRACIDRLWQPSAYVGSFGDLRSAAIAAYVRTWERLED